MLYNPRKVGLLIHSLRTEQQLSQELLSGLAGIARTHLAMIESGSKSANVETLWRISLALGLRLSTFILMLEEETD